MFKTISLNGIECVEGFVRLATDKPYDITLTSLDDKYRVDGKSVLGVLSLDLTQPVILICDISDNSVEWEDFNKYEKV